MLVKAIVFKLYRSFMNTNECEIKNKKKVVYRIILSNNSEKHVHAHVFTKIWLPCCYWFMIYKVIFAFVSDFFLAICMIFKPKSSGLCLMFRFFQDSIFYKKTNCVNWYKWISIKPLEIELFKLIFQISKVVTSLSLNRINFLITKIKIFYTWFIAGSF